VPPNEVVTLEGSTCRATRCTAATAVPSDTFGWRSNEIVTDGSCPEWLTVSGPTVEVMSASDASGTSGPVRDRM